jgi:hypothetical protein
MFDSSQFSYSIYGLGVKSFVRLPDLVESVVAEDVTINPYNGIDSSMLRSMADVRTFERPGLRSTVSAEGVVLELDKVGTFLIRNGSEVLVDPEPGVPDDDLQPFLTGPVMAILLHQRGLLVLHSSAVMIDGVAVCFLGNKGYGKSTIASQLFARGHKLISDDLAPLFFENDGPVMFPGFPKIKLYEDSIHAVGSDPFDFPLVHRFIEKRSFRCVDNFFADPIKLGCVFVLADSDETATRKLSRRQAFFEVTRNSFLCRYLEALNGQNQHFAQCQMVVKTTPFFALDRPLRFDAVDEVCEVVVETAQTYSDRIV